MKFSLFSQFFPFVREFKNLKSAKILRLSIFLLSKETQSELILSAFFTKMIFLIAGIEIEVPRNGFQILKPEILQNVFSPDSPPLEFSSSNGLKAQPFSTFHHQTPMTLVL